MDYSRSHRSPSGIAHVAWMACAVVCFSLSANNARAQGGLPASVLLRFESPSELALGGAQQTVFPNGSHVFVNASRLSRLAGLSAQIYGSADRTGALSFGLPVGDVVGIGAGIRSYGVGNIDFRNEREETIGTGSSTDLDLTGCIGISIGPGSVGIGLHYLNYSLSGAPVDNGATNGFSLDVSGSIEFQTYGMFGFAIRNLASTQSATYTSGINELIPVVVEANGDWFLMQSHVPERSSRVDPTGLHQTERLLPRSYLLATAGFSFSEQEAVVPFGLEYVPPFDVDGRRIGFRLGSNTNGELGFGLVLFDVLNELTPQNRIELSMRTGANVVGTRFGVGVDMSL